MIPCHKAVHFIHPFFPFVMPCQQFSALKPAYAKVYLVTGETADKCNQYNCTQIQIPQMSNEPADQQNRFSFQESACKQGIVSVCFDN